ncbi:MAG TPA: flagellar hook-basal body protein [Candidatus Mediterraneibacter norfolkensis]|nr:flagellar hook-basal body protein [Candidatus Mediterraneibacter norfolkensis]
MFQGFYRLTSGMLTQSRNLDVISNNMSNVTTPGFKEDRFIISDFQSELLLRTGNKVKAGTTVIGDKSMITAGDGTVTDYSQGTFSTTDSALDFAISGNGFFPVQTDDGTVYTRDGSFSLDDEGYLTLPGVGRVLGENGPIYLGTDRVTADSQGRIYDEQSDALLGQLMVVDFQDYDQLLKGEGNIFTSAGNAVQTDAQISWRTLENSNADPVEQMTRMMASQRALQSSAQIMRIYDQLISQMTTNLGPTQ